MLLSTSVALPLTLVFYSVSIYHYTISISFVDVAVTLTCQSWSMLQLYPLKVYSFSGK